MGSTVVRLRKVGDIRKFFAQFTDDCDVTPVDASYYFDDTGCGAIKLERAARQGESAPTDNQHAKRAEALREIAARVEDMRYQAEKNYVTVCQDWFTCLAQQLRALQ